MDKFNDVEAVNLGRKLAVLTDDQQVPICTMMDDEGEDTHYPGAACAFVAGPCKDGRWYSGLVADYNRAIVN